MKLIFFLIFCFADKLYSEDAFDNTYEINKQTKVSFTIPFKNFLITDKVNSKTSIDDLNNTKFEKFEKFSGFQPYKHYLKKNKIQQSP